MADTSIGIANPTAGTNRTTGTLAMWVKRGTLGATQYLYNERYDGSNMGAMYFTGGDNLSFVSYDGGSEQGQIVPTRKFRDTSGWYHLCFNWDTTITSPSADRMQVWVNGVRESILTVDIEPAEDTSLYFGLGSTSYPLHIGDSNGYFDGLMSHVYRVDNQALAGTVFGSTDAATGEFIINTSPSITYTGSSSFNFFIMEDGNGITDQSGEGNDLTLLNGTLTNTEDCPSDVFCTLNPLDNKWAASTFSNGNTTVLTISGNAAYNPSTMAVKKGKFYFEVKLVADSVGNAQEDVLIGISTVSPTTAAINGGALVYGISPYGGLGLRGNGNMWAGTTETSGWANIDVGDIVTMAVDFDNGFLYAGIDGVWGNSGDPTSGATGTGGYSFTVGDDDWFMGVNRRTTSATSTFSVNFGNGYFGTTAISSAGVNASDIGEFEFDVPTGYTALSTKGLNE